MQRINDKHQIDYLTPYFIRFNTHLYDFRKSRFPGRRPNIFLSKRNLLTTNYNEVIIDNAYKVIDNSF